MKKILETLIGNELTLYVKHGEETSEELVGVLEYFDEDFIVLKDGDTHTIVPIKNIVFPISFEGRFPLTQLKTKEGEE